MSDRQTPKIITPKAKHALELFSTQKACFENAQLKNHTFFFAVDKNENAEKEYGSTTNLEEFLEVYNHLESRNFYELLKDNFHRYEYYDIDMKTKDEPKKVFAKFNSIRDKFVKNEIGYDFSNPDWRVTDSSRFLEEDGMWKVSLHMLNKNVVFKNHDQTKEWYILFDKYNKNHDNIPDLFDGSVCSKNRCMRMLYSSKFGQNRPLIKEDLCEKYPDEDFFISNATAITLTPELLDGVFQQFEMDEFKYNKIERKRIDYEKTAKKFILVDEGNELDSLLTLIIENISEKRSSLCDNGTDKLKFIDFRNLAFAAIHAGADENLLIQRIFPLYRHSSQYSAEAICKNLMRSDRGGYAKCYTVSSLHFWARENPRYGSIFVSKKYHSTGQLSLYDTYSWGDFKEEMECSTFNSFEDCRKCFIANFNRACVVLAFESDNFYTKITDQMNDFIFREARKVVECNVKYLIVGKKGSQEEVTISFKKLYASCIDNIKRYHNFGFIPYAFRQNADIGDKYFNLFTGFRANYVEENDLQKIEPILNHIRDVWADGDELRFQYIMTWFAHIVQKPNEKTKIMPILYSDENQIGKGIILEWIIAQVFGLRHTAKTGSLKTIVGDFNGLTKHKILIAIDEVVNDVNYSARESEKFKTLITDSIQTINQKQIDPYQTLDCTNYIMLTNNRNAWNIGHKDARIAVFECSNKYARNTAYFDKLALVLRSEGVADAFYTYLCDYSLAINLKDIPKTEIREDMIFQTAEQPIKYFHYVTSGDYAPTFKTVERNGKVYATSSDMYCDFLNWVSAFGEKQGIYSLSKFSKFCRSKFGATKVLKVSTDNLSRVFDVTNFKSKQLEEEEENSEDEFTLEIA